MASGSQVVEDSLAIVGTFVIEGITLGGTILEDTNSQVDQQQDTDTESEDILQLGKAAAEDKLEDNPFLMAEDKPLL